MNHPAAHRDNAPANRLRRAIDPRREITRKLGVPVAAAFRVRAGDPNRNRESLLGPSIVWLSRQPLPESLVCRWNALLLQREG